MCSAPTATPNRPASGRPPRAEARKNVDTGHSHSRCDVLARGVVADVKIALADQGRKQPNPPAPYHNLPFHSIRTQHSRHALLIQLDDLWLVIHLARAGWLRLREDVPAAPLKRGKGPMAMRIRFDGTMSGAARS